MLKSTSSSAAENKPINEFKVINIIALHNALTARMVAKRTSSNIDTFVMADESLKYAGYDAIQLIENKIDEQITQYSNQNIRLEINLFTDFNIGWSTYRFSTLKHLIQRLQEKTPAIKYVKTEKDLTSTKNENNTVIKLFLEGAGEFELDSHDPRLKTPLPEGVDSGDDWEKIDPAVAITNFAFEKSTAMNFLKTQPGTPKINSRSLLPRTPSSSLSRSSSSTTSTSSSSPGPTSTPSPTSTPNSEFPDSAGLSRQQSDPSIGSSPSPTLDNIPADGSFGTPEQLVALLAGFKLGSPTPPTIEETTGEDNHTSPKQLTLSPIRTTAGSSDIPSTIPSTPSLVVRRLFKEVNNATSSLSSEEVTPVRKPGL